MIIWSQINGKSKFIVLFKFIIMTIFVFVGSGYNNTILISMYKSKTYWNKHSLIITSPTLFPNIQILWSSPSTISQIPETSLQYFFILFSFYRLFLNSSSSSFIVFSSSFIFVIDFMCLLLCSYICERSYCKLYLNC